MDARFGNLQLQCQQQFDHDSIPTFDHFTVEDMLNLPDDMFLNQDVEPNLDHFDDHHNPTDYDQGREREERRQLISIEGSAVKGSSRSRKSAELAHLQWISEIMGEDSCSSENLNKLAGTTMSAMKARPDERSEIQYYPLKPARDESDCSETQYYPLKPARDESDCSETQYYPLKPARDESVSPSSILDTETSTPTKKAARSKRPRTSSDSWVSVSRPAVLSQGDSEPIQVTSPTKPVGSKKKGSGGKHRPTIDSTQGGEARKCLHCATDKTPQWRSGPMGPKTLCNACGVRYKSGRLVPEYRPAASPTFVMAKHSNSHRKVLELQRQKNAMRLQDMQQQQQQFQHDHFNHHIPNNSMMFNPSINDDYLINQHFGHDNFGNII
ncbi:unnamed protein product [Amaranthus hypochondriacus]